MASKGLDKTGQHSIPLLLVAVTKLLAECLLLAPGPAAHVDDTGADEDSDGPAAADQNNTNPSENLKHVVWAGDQVATNAVGDTLFGAAGLAEAGQVLMDDPVARLTDGKDGEAEVVERDKLITSRKVAGSVNVQRAKQTGHEPVEGRIAEDVAGGHGVGRELVDEDGLVLALEEVNLEQREEDPLHLGDGGSDLVLVVEGSDAVDVRADEGDEGMEEDGAEVLDHEDGSPCDLGACFTSNKRGALELSFQATSHRDR